MLPAWRRYFAIARRIVISRAVSLRREDEPVEAVVLGLAAPRARERVLEHLAHVVRLELGALVVAEPEVVDPDRRPVGRLDLVRPLVADPDAHVLEQRQHVREEDRPARTDELEGEVVERRLERDVEAHPEVAVRVEPLDPLDVLHGLPGGEVLAVGAGERLAVAFEERAGTLLAELLRERVAEVVGPGARRRGEASLDLGHVVLRDRARLGVDDDVEARQHRLGDARRVVDARPGEGLAGGSPGSAAGSSCRSARAAGRRGTRGSGRTRPGGRTAARAGARRDGGSRARSRRARPPRSGTARRADTSRGSRRAPCGRGCPSGAPTARPPAAPCAAGRGSPTGSRCRRCACRARGSAARRSTSPEASKRLTPT